VRSKRIRPKCNRKLRSKHKVKRLRIKNYTARPKDIEKHKKIDPNDVGLLNEIINGLDLDEDQVFEQLVFIKAMISTLQGLKKNLVNDEVDQELGKTLFNFPEQYIDVNVTYPIPFEQAMEHLTNLRSAYMKQFATLARQPIS